MLKSIERACRNTTKKPEEFDKVIRAQSKTKKIYHISETQRVDAATAQKGNCNVSYNIIKTKKPN